MARKKKISKDDADKAKALLRRIEKLKKEADRVRDDLREATDEARDIAYSFEEAGEDIEQALCMLRGAVDRMSEYV